MTSRKHWETLDQESPAKIVQAVVEDQALKMAIYKNMNGFGGSFVKALGEAMLRADRKNLATLCDAFLEYILKYLPKNWP